MSARVHDANSDYYAGSRPELREFLPQTYSRVLEVGCGRGGFRANLSGAIDVWGIEPFVGVAEVAKSRLNRVLIGRYEDVQSQLPEAAFDLVVCNDVIEHMADDVGFLQSIRSKMQVGGYLMGSVPNMRNFPVLRALVFDKEWEYQDEGILDRTHLRFYTINSFPKLLRRTGFELIKIAGINEHVGRKTWFIRRLLNSAQFADTRWQQFAFLAKISG